MGQHHRGAFVRRDDLHLEPVPGGLLLEGTIYCVGGIEVWVKKVVRKLTDEDDPLVVRGRYSYNVSLTGRGNIFRYDGPHVGHRSCHHVHRYDVLEGDDDGSVTVIHDEDDTPHLSEVIEEAERWYYDHLSELE